MYSMEKFVLVIIGKYNTNVDVLSIIESVNLNYYDVDGMSMEIIHPNLFWQMSMKSSWTETLTSINLITVNHFFTAAN